MWSLLWRCIYILTQIIQCGFVLLCLRFETVSECEEECEDNVCCSRLREDSQSSESKDEEFQVVRMITECLARYNNKSHAKSNGGFDDDEGTLVIGGDEFRDKDLMDVLHKSKIPLYEGAQTTRLVAQLLLLNCFTVFGVSNACADEILKLVNEILPIGNNLSKLHSK